MTYATEAFERSVARQLPQMVSAADEADGEAAAHNVPVADMVLDWLGTVRHCGADAARLFSVSACALIGRHVKQLIPDLPISPNTPWYNLAYATFWAHQGPQRGFWGLDNRGRAFDLQVALGRLERDEGHQIIVALAATGGSCLIAGTDTRSSAMTPTCALVGRLRKPVANFILLEETPIYPGA